MGHDHRRKARQRRLREHDRPRPTTPTPENRATVDEAIDGLGQRTAPDVIEGHAVHRHRR